MQLSPSSATCWRAYLDTLDEPDAADACFYEAFRIGDSAASADEGARLIETGIKTATSSLFWEYEATGSQPPTVGALSIVEDGHGQPRCIVETTDATVLPFDAVDAQFAFDYGEWDRSLATWRDAIWRYYAVRCEQLDKPVSAEMPLVCERFRVVYRCTG